MTLESLLLLLAPYHRTLPFLAAIFGGEEVIILIAMLSAKNIIPFWDVFIFAYAGTLVSDALWFYIARHKWLDKMHTKKLFSKGYKKIAYTIDVSTRSNHFVALLITKFLYGTRIITIMYLSREKMTFSKFSYYNALVTFIWISVICPLGWFAGRGFVILIDMLENVQVAAIGFVAFAIGFYYLRIWINKKLTRNQNQ